MEVRLRLFSDWDTLFKYIVVGSPLVSRGDHAAALHGVLGERSCPLDVPLVSLTCEGDGMAHMEQAPDSSLPAVSKDEIPLRVTQNRAAPLQKMLSS